MKLGAAAKKRWMRKPRWNLREFAMLCCGWDPDGPIENESEYAEAVKLIASAFRSGELPVAFMDRPPEGPTRH